MNSRIRIAASIAALAGLCVAAGTARAANVTVMDLEFTDGTLPSASGLQYTNFGKVVTEASAYSVSGGVLHQTTFEKAGRADYFFRTTLETGANIDPSRSVISEFGLQIFSVSG